MRWIAPFSLVCALAASAAAAPPSGKAPPAAVVKTEQRSLEIEITETASGKASPPVRLVLPLVVDAAPAEMRVRERGASYHVIAAARRHRGGSLIVELNLERRETSDGSPSDFEIKTQAVPERGKRSTLVAAERPDGSRLEIALELD